MTEVTLRQYGPGCHTDLVTASGLRERKKEKTREALVDSALSQFTARGFDRVTVEEIAAACEVSPRTFFRYFASKEDVLFAEGDAHRTRLLTSLAEQDPSVPPFQALESAMRMVAADYAEYGDVLRLRHHIVTSTPSLRTRAAERQQGWETVLMEHLRASGRARRMSDLELRLVVAATTTALRVAAEAWIGSGGRGDLTRFLDAAFQRLRAGFDS
jgi:AcrR family transcriptional regulator